MSLLTVDNSNFDKEVLQSNLPVLVDFGADWCGPCKRQLPVLEQFATDNLDKVKVVKIDVDDAPELATKYKVRSVPCLILFDKGELVDTKVGLSSAVELSLLLGKAG